MLFVENIKLALNSIYINRMRSFLTMLGIIIGISSVIAITSIGDSAKKTISDEFSGLGSFMFIELNYRSQADDGSYNWYQYFLSEDDIEALCERFPDDIRYAAPSVYGSSKITVGKKSGNLELISAGADYFKYDTRETLIYGRGINEQDVMGKRDVIVIDKKTALELFNKENAVGKTITATLGGALHDLVVIGVVQKEESIFTQLKRGGSYRGFVPYKILLDSDGLVSYIEVFGNEKEDQVEQGNKYAKYIEKIKKAPEGTYKAQTMQSQLSIANKILSILSVAIGAIAGIALIVGGIGIMNIMLVSVTERTREIGIRKSLGARTNDILMQFLLEAMILSLIGGIIGVLFGVSIAAIGMTAVKAKVAINPFVILIAVTFSALVGIGFGIFPARRAAKLDPIEALRYE